jgi:hypothetical protein
MDRKYEYKMKQIIHIVYEGFSEREYFGQLNRLFRDLNINIVFQFKDYNCQGNTPKQVKEKYKKAQSRRNEKHNEQIWTLLDYDCFKREKRNLESFKFIKDDFYFFIYNFEDFLMQHLPYEVFLKWINICCTTKHIDSPLSGAEIEKFAKQILPNYKKGTMPFDLMKSHLENLKSNQEKEIFVKKPLPKNIANFIAQLLSIIKIS